MKLPGLLFDDRNQGRALFFNGGFVAVRSASARVMTANHRSRSLSVMTVEWVITELDIAHKRGKKEGIYSDCESLEQKSVKAADYKREVANPESNQRPIDAIV